MFYSYRIHDKVIVEKEWRNVAKWHNKRGKNTGKEEKQRKITSCVKNGQSVSERYNVSHFSCVFSYRKMFPTTQVQFVAYDSVNRHITSVRDQEGQEH
jgi:hypothetical protein